MGAPTTIILRSRRDRRSPAIIAFRPLAPWRGSPCAPPSPGQFRRRVRRLAVDVVLAPSFVARAPPFLAAPMATVPGTLFSAANGMPEMARARRCPGTATGRSAAGAAVAKRVERGDARAHERRAPPMADARPASAATATARRDHVVLHSRRHSEIPAIWKVTLAGHQVAPPARQSRAAVPAVPADAFGRPFSLASRRPDRVDDACYLVARPRG